VRTAPRRRNRRVAWWKPARIGTVCGGCGNAPAEVRRLSSMAIGRGMYRSHSCMCSGFEVSAVMVRSEPSDGQLAF
jgi:hypothetical protein